MTKLTSQNPPRVPQQSKIGSVPNRAGVEQAGVKQTGAAAEVKQLDQGTSSPESSTYQSGQLGSGSRAQAESMSPKGQQVLQNFLNHVETRSEMSARDLFDPAVNRIDGAGLHKQIPDDVMKKMVTDTVKKMPLCDLPGGHLLAASIREIPGADHIEGDVSKMSYTELRKGLSQAGKDILDEKFKPLVKDFRKEHKAAFYSLAALGAVGVGALGYAEGSDALRKLGIKPKLKQKFFDSRLRATIEADWGKKLSDPSGKVGLEAHTQDQRLSLIASAKVDSSGVKSAEIHGRARIDNKPLGLDSLSLHASYSHDFSTEQDLSSLGISGSKGAMSFTATDYRNWSTGDSRTQLDVGAKVWGGRLSGYAAHIKDNNTTDNQVGVVYRVAF